MDGGDRARRAGGAVLDALWGAVAPGVLDHDFSHLRYRLAVLLSPEVGGRVRAQLAGRRAAQI